MDAENVFDAVVLGTGLTESIAAAALSKAGFKVAHVDTNPFYGADQASLSADELIRWAKQRTDTENRSTYLSLQRVKFTSVSCSSSSLSEARQYSLSLSPSIIPSRGPLISALVSSGVSRYGGFRLLERVGIYDCFGSVKPVPWSKDDIFKSKSISLIDKRRLMRFLMFAAGEFEGSKELVGKENSSFREFLKTNFSLTEEIAAAVAYSLAYCSTSTDPALPSLLRTRRYLRSAGRYGVSPFLVGHYGGLGEIAQGFCRMSAVHGGVYILGRAIADIEFRPNDLPETNTCSYTVRLTDFPDDIKCNLIISMPDYLPPHLAQKAEYVSDSEQHSPPTAKGIAIVDRPLRFDSHAGSTLSREDVQPVSQTQSETTCTSVHGFESDDSSVIIFPPSSVDGGSSSTSVTAMITGSDTMSAPSGRWIIHLSMPLMTRSTVQDSADSPLRPYLSAILSLLCPTSPLQPLFTAFYIQNPFTTPVPAPTQVHLPSLIVTPPPAHLLPDSADSSATNAETVFWKAIPILRAARQRHAPEPHTEMTTDDDIETFWPVLDAGDERNSDGEW